VRLLPVCWLSVESAVTAHGPLAAVTAGIGRTLERHIEERLRDLELVLEEKESPPLRQ
jgi:hypothetical protein